MRHADAAGAKILLVDAHEESREALGHAFREGGYEVAMAPSGSFAVTMLEWECPDLVVSCAKVADMDGYELFTFVRRDPTTMDTPFLLLAGRDRPTALAAAEAGVSMVLTGDVTPEGVVERAGELLKTGPSDEARRPIRRLHPAGPRKTVEPLWAAIEAAGPKPQPVTGAATFQGSLGVMDLAEVTQAISLGGKTGCLVVALSLGEGAMRFEAGRLVHAAFLDKTGEAAFGALISASQWEAEASFRFNQSERAEIAHLPRTISRSVDQLLLSIAAGIDEDGAGPGQAQTVAPINEQEG